MNHIGDEQSPAEDARPFLPTEIEHPYPPAGGARPFLPTDIENPYPLTPAGPAYQPTYTRPAASRPSYIPAHGRLADQRPGQGGPIRTRAHEIWSRGSPPSPTGGTHTAERVWRTGHAGGPPRRLRRWRGRASAALTVILLAASAGVLYLRFHHAPFHVTGVTITQRTPNGCGVDVTGQISTNGAAGAVSYQWLFQPGREAPQQLSKSVAAGQNAVYVTVALQGSGHGSASRTVTL